MDTVNQSINLLDGWVGDGGWDGIAGEEEERRGGMGELAKHHTRPGVKVEVDGGSG